MSRLVPFSIEHLAVMDVVPIYTETILGLENVRFVLKHMPGSGESVSVICDGKIIACMGYTVLLPGVAEVWMIPSIYVKEYSMYIVRMIKRYLLVQADTFKWHRIQTVTPCDHFSRRWMEALGFEEEGIMRKYFRDQDYVISAMLIKQE